MLEPPGHRDPTLKHQNNTTRKSLFGFGASFCTTMLRSVSNAVASLDCHMLFPPDLTLGGDLFQAVISLTNGCKEANMKQSGDIIFSIGVITRMPIFFA